MKGAIRSTPRKPAAVPNRMPATATKDESASVEIPVSPCPIEHPNAMAPPDPIKAAKLMIDHIDKKRKALGIDKARERVLFDMAKRRELDAA